MEDKKYTSDKVLKVVNDLCLEILDKDALYRGYSREFDRGVSQLTHRLNDYFNKDRKDG